MNIITPQDIKKQMAKLFKELTPQDQDEILISESVLKLVKSFFCSKDSAVFKIDNRTLAPKTLIQVFLNIIQNLTEEQRDKLEIIMKESDPSSHTIFKEIRKRVKE